MSLEMAAERVCYVHCSFCNTILAVSVPSSSLFTIVTVRCGHCANLLSVNMAASLQPVPIQDPQKQQLVSSTEGVIRGNGSSSSTAKRLSPPFESLEHEHPKLPPIRPPEKRQRVPSAYNRFIKEEIQRIKAINPEISHREAFSTAAKNASLEQSESVYGRKAYACVGSLKDFVAEWAHFPHIHFGLKLDGNKQGSNQVIAGDTTLKSHGF